MTHPRQGQFPVLQHLCSVCRNADGNRSTRMVCGFPDDYEMTARDEECESGAIHCPVCGDHAVVFQLAGALQPGEPGW